MTIVDRVTAVTVNKLGAAEGDVRPETRFAEDLCADDLETVELILGFEDEFGVTITDEEAQAIQTVQGAADLIERKR
ncbi:acyl carrier protein [Deinococcus soli (ex Cha et al. 2016)]|uniref:Acyl carrier protein n=2 Tax=Deinococcus soli (ex Cha et al. 2016) TaxID=1309411 RepID=A0AAE4BNQ5_9DEIO|nr:acyl carrier protein [Deinococcus soli (ex Cha et al. 2016)]MDR6218961.1 acyl carrier protein [Deinococcus soli (ex Cha et al. 2016)]MDR6328758.1 acyl carrier protein [Deinococcus soli (ex Cha et al. 2016)]MDR6751755.1 acyl carrier protein [Deinococcus soli (ex Cha et al. 2016)]